MRSCWLGTAWEPELAKSDAAAVEDLFFSLTNCHYLTGHGEQAAM